MMFVPDYSSIWKVSAAALVAAALLSTAAGYGIHSCERQQDEAATTALLARRAAHQRATDSAYFFTAGRHYEVQRQLDSLTSHAETISTAGSGLVLPAHPPRQ